MSISAHSSEKMLLNYIGKDSLDFAQQIADFYTLQALQEKKEPQLKVIKNTPIDIRNINRQIQFYQNLDIINNPKTKTDEKNKEKLLNFIAASKKLKIINNKTLFIEWNKLRCNNKKPSYNNLLDLLNHYRNNPLFQSCNIFVVIRNIKRYHNLLSPLNKDLRRNLLQN